MEEDKKELTWKVSKLEGDLLYNSTQMKVMSLHVERI